MSSSFKPYEPAKWVSTPTNKECGFQVQKNGEDVAQHYIGKQSFTIFGRNKDLCQVVLAHASISRQHAVVAHGSSGNCYVVDLGSSHGTYITRTLDPKKKREKLQPQRREVIRNDDMLEFGASSRKFVFKYRFSKKRKADSRDKRDGKRKRGSDGESVTCLHLLVKHAESRRPSSWREENITRTKDEAEEKILKLLKKVKSGETTVAELAKNESDCSSAARGGDLGSFERGRMQKPFEEAAFGLKVGEISGPVHTASGVHIIERTA